MTVSCSRQKSAEENPFFEPFDTPYQTVPFDRIETGHFLPAIQKGIEKGREEIRKIAENPAEADFENTVEALERAGEDLSLVSSVFFNLHSAETSDAIDSLAEEISPLLTEYSNDILLNKPLFERIDKVYRSEEKKTLSPEQNMLLEQTWKSFSRNGALLNEQQKDSLRVIDQKLAALSLRFQKNVLTDTNDFILHISDSTRLEGLPEGAMQAAAEQARQKGLDGWAFTLQAPSYIPFMTYVKDRDLRRQMALAYGSRGNKEGQTDNRELIRQIVSLRDERARLLGYPTHAHFVLEENMARTPEKVEEFLLDFLQKALPAGKEQVEELKKYALEKDGITDFRSFDHAYYAERLKAEKYALEEEKLKPYFELDKVIAGAFEVASRLYGLRFEQVHDIPVYHPDVRTYRVTDSDGNFVAVFYGDYFPREGKRSGAWMNHIIPQSIRDGENRRPHIINVCNFTRPTQDTPSLLTFEEVTTLFHEFGHALHGMLANTTYASLSGTNVPVDFVELPSQLMENWCYQPEALKLFATHYQTGEIIPSSLIESIKAASNYLEGYQTLRQLSFGILDMAYHYHTRDFLETGKDIADYEHRVGESSQVYRPLPGTAMSPAFLHIFAGGYSAGYYSYKWSEVLDADAFEKFEADGIFNRQTGESFKENILSKGYTESPDVLYRRFRGKDAAPDALLKRAGLLPIGK